eukprot:CAMPEP_0173388766 /NCGR_PEP_ID=MMETSP1356-20130122/11000_1 /TAXON_ID=77927 ORGANISM="Hemiselmis virescens, Strain PCC157" /NCGR_SAMPLE_ID=MMETSP1356 /ASSEMBLY_ACC=CAM_ASM_000847 /LENGTH=55 /DNA_ID=CAMNT_0014345755 /DNA_START=800 /DNA_END=964 /DNA_ORIENTATION=-
MPPADASCRVEPALLHAGCREGTGGRGRGAGSRGDDTVVGVSGGGLVRPLRSRHD